jgi:hypothetical protein
MLDVHPPHSPTHTWKDFFVHIATIVVGLLIAVGLEQTVEAIHHHHQIVEVRQALEEERRENIQRFRTNLKNHLESQALLHNNLRVFFYLRDHPRGAPDQRPGLLVWPIGITEPLTAAWSTAGQTGVLELLPHTEVAADTLEYSALSNSSAVYQEAILLQYRCVAYLNSTSDPATLTPAEIQQEIADLQLRTSVETYYGYTLYLLAKKFPAYGPTPGRTEIDPFFAIDAGENGTAAQQALTLKDVQQAVSALPKAAEPAPEAH